MSEHAVSAAPGQGSATELLRLVAALDLDSADGRAGIRALLREIEATAPGSLEMMAAERQLSRLGIPAPNTN